MFVIDIVCCVFDVVVCMVLNVVLVCILMIGLGVFFVELCDIIKYDVEWFFIVSFVLVVVLLFMVY